MLLSWHTFPLTDLHSAEHLWGRTINGESQNENLVEALHVFLKQSLVKTITYFCSKLEYPKYHILSLTIYGYTLRVH